MRPWVPGLLLLLGLLAAGCRSRPAGEPIPPEVLARGADLYRRQCQDCHGGPRGGRISDIPPPHNRNGHTWHHPDCQLREIVLDGFDRGEPGVPAMPAFRDRLAGEDVDAILAYIKTWWTAEQRETQARITRERC